MIQSMTGFGNSVVNLSNKKVSFQLKSLNSKKFDLYTRIPSEYSKEELIFHKMIASALGRGKVEFTLSIESLSGQTSSVIDKAAVQHYMTDLKSLVNDAVNTSDAEFLKIAMRLPNTLKSVKEEISEDEISALKQGLTEALKNINQYRSDEGKALEKDFKLRIKNIANLLEEVEKIDADRIAEKRNKLREAVTTLKEDVDENRFEQELVYYIEKYDINEEKTRLKNHLEYFVEALDEPDSNGKKLGFITQEMGREINTLGSKSNHAPMQKLVVEMKDELDKIKEQVLNVL